MGEAVGCSGEDVRNAWVDFGVVAGIASEEPTHGVGTNNVW